MNRVIYADNAATTKLDRQALDEMLPWLELEFGNASQPYSFARNPKKALKEAREDIAACIGASPEEIVFTSGGTESDNWVIKGLISNDNRQEIITSTIEHHAMLNSCKAQQAIGVPVSYISVSNAGIVEADKLNSLVSDNTKLVSVMLANNEIGTIEPIKQLAKIAHENGAKFHTDAVQAVGHIPIDVDDLGVDYLSASAHKFNGPKGIGFLYIRKGVSLEPFIHGGEQEKGLRAGTENIASIVGMAKALEINCKQMAENDKKLRHLEQLLTQELFKCGVAFFVNGSNYKLPGNVNISIKNADGEMLLHRLDLMGIMVSTGSACDSKNTHISHVIKAIGVPEEYAQGTIRITFGRDNTEEEAVAIAQSIVKILKQ